MMRIYVCTVIRVYVNLYPYIQLHLNISTTEFKSTGVEAVVYRRRPEAAPEWELAVLTPQAAWKHAFFQSFPVLLHPATRNSMSYDCYELGPRSVGG